MLLNEKKDGLADKKYCWYTKWRFDATICVFFTSWFTRTENDLRLKRLAQVPAG